MPHDKYFDDENDSTGPHIKGNQIRYMLNKNYTKRGNDPNISSMHQECFELSQLLSPDNCLVEQDPSLPCNVPLVAGHQKKQS